MKSGIIHSKQVYSFGTAFVWLLFLFACSNSETSKKNNLQEQKKSEAPIVIYKKPPSSFNDTIVVSRNTAVFFNSDSLQLENIKTITEKMVFENSIHDCFYQMRNAKMVLKESWPQIKVVDISKARYLLFIKKDNSQECMDLDVQNDMCGLFLFNGIKKPQLVDMMNIATELNFYFKK